MSEHTTQKSFKTQRRDKPKHSNKDVGTAKKGGAGGRGTWGAEKDDVKYMNEDGHAFDNNDPNFDPADQEEGGYKMKVVQANGNKFNANHMGDLTKYKARVRDALGEFLVSHEAAEFVACVKDPTFSLYHQDVPAILIKYSLDKADGDRTKISELLQQLHKENIVTTSQMAQGFRKLYNITDQLCVDAPKSKVILSEFVGHAHAGGYLSGQALAAMEEEAAMLGDAKAVQATKAKITSICTEYLASGELEELSRGVEGVPKPMRFDVVKQLVYIAMDHSDHYREYASRALAELVGGALGMEPAVKGFTVLFDRVEDMKLDVPDLPQLLALMVARAISDEALPPSFLLRLDLAELDQGFQVAAEAHAILQQPHASERLAAAWGAEQA